MLRVRAIRKFHDSKGVLLGYTIQDETGSVMNVHKEQLKTAIINGAVECVNMTLTSDGRLIGRAAPKPLSRKTENKKSGKTLLEVYTNGRNIVAGLVDESLMIQKMNRKPIEYKSLNLGYSFDTGFEVTKFIESAYYDNLIKINGNVDTSSVKRKSFSKVKTKLMKILRENGIEISLEVVKGINKYEYVIVINNYESIKQFEVIIKIIYSIIIDKCITDKIKVVSTDNSNVVVSCLTGIGDVRKIAKSVISDIKKA